MKHREHFNWNAYHLEEVLAQELDAAQIDARVAELAILHSGANDCRIVAECEDKAARVDALATFDAELIKHLKDEARIVVATPNDCWHRAAIPHGTAPSRVLSPDHPLVKAGLVALVDPRQVRRRQTGACSILASIVRRRLFLKVNNPSSKHR